MTPPNLLKKLSIQNFLFIFTLLALTLFTGCASTPDDETRLREARKLYEDAIRLRGLNLSEEMYEKLEAAVKMAPEEPVYSLAYANALFSDGRFDEAETRYKDVLKLNENFSEAYRNLGRLYMQKGQWAQAVDYLERSLRQKVLKDPNELYNWIAICYYAMGKFELAEKNWKKALELKDSFEIRLNLALAYRDNEVFDLARASLEKALELNPKSDRGHYELAQLYLKDRNFAQAKQHFNQVIHLSPLSEMSKASRQYLKMLPPDNTHGQ